MYEVVFSHSYLHYPETAGGDVCTLLAVVSRVYSCRLFKNKYEVIFFLITYFFHLTKYRLPTQETCTSAHHRGEQPLVLLCCDLFKRSTVRLPPVSS